MKVKYLYVTGETVEIEVEDELGAIIVDMERKAENLARKERYHNAFSMDGADYEGCDAVDKNTPEGAILKDEFSQKIDSALLQLTETQRKRLLMLSDGMSIREIARREEVDHKAVKDSISQARKKIMKFI